MGIFAIGTAPGLLGIGGLTSLIQGSFSKLFFKFVGLVVISLAVLNLINASNLLDWHAISSKSDIYDIYVPSNPKTDPNVTLENGIQVVRMIENNRGYIPNSFTIKKDIPVKWIIDAQNVYSCASSIVSRDLKLSKTLESGENIINFTPQKTGTISFSCSMGMYRGVFTVAE